MYPVGVARIIQKLFPDLVWRIPADRKVLYLTFDDGPDEEVTPEVLKLLDQYNAKATFFCVGNNLKKHPEIAERLRGEGHVIGNHTFNHTSGFKVKNRVFYREFLKTAQLADAPLFRPPFGRITPTQAKRIKKRAHIIMWDVLSWDFNTRFTADECTRNVIKNARPGSIIIFHDSKKAAPRALPALERVLKHFSDEGYVFEAITGEVVGGL